MKQVTAYIGLGANLGEAGKTLAKAIGHLEHTSGISELRTSRLYRSAPVDAGGPDFLNAVAGMRTSLSAHALLATLLDIEGRHGRLRPYRNAPRTLDLDLLWYDDQEIAEPDLAVPHPRMHERAFVLLPLRDLAPGLILPWGPLDTLIAACGDQRIDVLNDPRWAAP